MKLTALDDDYRENPYRIYKELRERAPVHKDHEMGRVFCTRQEDVKTLCHDKAFFTDPRKANPGMLARLRKSKQGCSYHEIRTFRGFSHFWVLAD